jgi:hypothetical protein
VAVALLAMPILLPALLVIFSRWTSWDEPATPPGGLIEPKFRKRRWQDYKRWERPVPMQRW